MHRVEGRVQHYAWGDTTTLPALLDTAPDGRPWAEYWIGTHRRGPGLVLDDEGSRPLEDLTGPLPFLVKLLAANEPLSLQLHPDAIRARAGFEAEQRAGIALEDERRRYADPEPKPEMICALGRFEALCGFAPDAVVHRRLAVLGRLGAEIADRLALYGRRATVAWLLGQRPALDDLRDRARDLPDTLGPALVPILGRWPEDPAGAVAVLLNHVILEPYQALALEAGRLHAYLEGSGVEVMGPSDNVIRGGWTAKTVDVDALIELVDEDPLEDPLLERIEVSHPTARLWRWAPTSMPFRLERWEASDTTLVEATGPEVWWCERPAPGGVAARVAVTVAGETARLEHGSAWFRTCRATLDT